MSDLFQITLWLSLATILLIIKLLVHGLRDLIVPVCLFYFYFAFGPVIGYLMGFPIYFGTPQEYIPEASLIFFIGIATLILVSFLLPPKKEFYLEKVQGVNLNTLKPLIYFSCFYAAAVTGSIAVRGGDLSKVQKISLLSPVIHYSYLMIQLYLISFFFLVKKSKIWKLFLVNFTLYVLYSLAIGERDFIFPLISIMIHQYVFFERKKGGLLKLAFASVGLTLIAISIFFFRDASQAFDGITAAALNQGSLLFINTYTLKLLNERVDYFMGYTYLNTLMNLLPGWIYRTDFNTLDWFKSLYAAKSDSGYGYALDAEGFLNFSYFGVVLTFSSIGIFLRKITYKIGTHPYYTYMSVFLTAFTMYSLRNDSLAFIKGSLYATFFFFIILKTSQFFPGREEE